MLNLSEDQRFYLAIAAGCRVTSIVSKDGTLRLETEYPIGFVEINGSLAVVEASKPARLRA